jgi:hypothetical protein
MPILVFKIQNLRNASCLYFNITVAIVAHTKHTITNTVSHNHGRHYCSPSPEATTRSSSSSSTVTACHGFLFFLFLFFFFFKHNTTILFHSAAATRRHIMVHRHDVLEGISAPLGTHDWNCKARWCSCRCTTLICALVWWSTTINDRNTVTCKTWEL